MRKPNPTKIITITWINLRCAQAGQVVESEYIIHITCSTQPGVGNPIQEPMRGSMRERKRVAKEPFKKIA
jgi:hypothetical protein